jgi:hypothetical protein
LTVGVKDLIPPALRLPSARDAQSEARSSSPRQESQPKYRAAAGTTSGVIFIREFFMPAADTKPVFFSFLGTKIRRPDFDRHFLVDGQFVPAFQFFIIAPRAFLAHKLFIIDRLL